MFKSKQECRKWAFLISICVVAAGMFLLWLQFRATNWEETRLGIAAKRKARVTAHRKSAAWSESVSVAESRLEQAYEQVRRVEERVRWLSLHRNDALDETEWRRAQEELRLAREHLREVKSRNGKSFAGTLTP